MHFEIGLSKRIKDKRKIESLLTAFQMKVENLTLNKGEMALFCRL